MIRQVKKTVSGCLFLMIFTAAAALGDGFIVIPPPFPRPVTYTATPYPLEVTYHHVETTIDEMAAITSVDQEFYNPTGRRLEGYYLFPIPEGAVISKFSM
jgi:hypothetical protein